MQTLLSPAQVETRKNIRSRLVAKTVKNENYTYTQLSHNRIVRFRYDGTLPVASGSSWNRQKKQRAKNNGTPGIDTGILHTIYTSTSTNEIMLSGQGEINSGYSSKQGLDNSQQFSKPVHEPHSPGAKGEDKKCRKYKLSPRTAEKIREKMSAFYRATTKKTRVLLTLSFINDVTDKDGVKVLNKFFTALQGTQGKINYLWVAERQTETKRIHFHIIIDRRLSITYVNNLWVLQQYNSGITHPKMTYEKMMQCYKDGTLQKNGLNPADIVKINGIDKLSGYLTNYLTGASKDEFECLVWHCTRTVSRLFTRYLVSAKVAYEGKNKDINYGVNKKTGEYFEAKTYQHQWTEIIYLQNRRYFADNYLQDLEAINRWIMQQGEILDDFKPEIPKYHPYFFGLELPHRANLKNKSLNEIWN